MIITCPHCQTKYQVTYEAIGSVSRKVQCAQCQQAWEQRAPARPSSAPDDGNQFDALAEDAMDELLASEAESATTEDEPAREVAPQSTANKKLDPAMLRRQQKAFTRRRSAMEAELPLARLRRTLRILGFLSLGVVLVVGYFGRVQVVERFPEMAGAYAAVGLGVNVVGLDFTNVTTMRTKRDGSDVLHVSAQIVGLMPDPVKVPAVVVTLLDANGRSIYEWSVTPSVRDLMAGERSTFDTQLTLPPGDAARVRLSFAGGHTIAASAGSAGEVITLPAQTPEQPAAAAASDHPNPEQH